MAFEDIRDLDLEQHLKTKTTSEINAELAELEREEKALDLELKREAVAKIRAAKQVFLDSAKQKVMATKQFLAARKAKQEHCNHRKGGIGAGAVLNGEGTSAMYCVIKHVLPTGKHFILCQRCNAEWQAGDPLLNIQETPGYQEAVRWATDNTASGSSRFFFERVQLTD